MIKRMNKKGQTNPTEGIVGFVLLGLFLVLFVIGMYYFFTRGEDVAKQIPGNQVILSSVCGGYVTSSSDVSGTSLTDYCIVPREVEFKGKTVFATCNHIAQNYKGVVIKDFDKMTE